ncbi:MAG: formamidopyrimidine-DNA glycosylase [Phycisphaerae bacterium]
MPELPEVETVARGVGRLATGRVIASVRLIRPDVAHGQARPSDRLLRGRRIECVSRRGKQIHIDFSGGLSMIVHLGMTGRLSVCPKTAPQDPHTHLRMAFADRDDELRFVDPRRFGGVWLIASAPRPDRGGDERSTGQPATQSDAAPRAARPSLRSPEARRWYGRRLPPVGEDPLTLSLADWRRLLARRRQIKALLLDQRPISGVGNIYCDEALHRAGIHPLRRANELPPAAVDRLYRALRRVLIEAIAAGGSSVNDYRDADGKAGWFQTRHRVYGREGRTCRRCRTPIEKILAAGRGTHFCPHCQPRA